MKIKEERIMKKSEKPQAKKTAKKSMAKKTVKPVKTANSTTATKPKIKPLTKRQEQKLTDVATAMKKAGFTVQRADNWLWFTKTKKCNLLHCGMTARKLGCRFSTRRMMFYYVGDGSKDNFGSKLETGALMKKHNARAM